MSIWNIIIIVCLVVLVLYLVLDKLIMPVIRHRRNIQKSANAVFGMFYDPITGFWSFKLCPKRGEWYVQAPPEHKELFKKNGKEEEPLSYCLIGTKVAGYTPEGKPIEEHFRATGRALWPAETRASEQVLVEVAAWVKGKEQALDPTNNLIPVNTGRMSQIIREEKTAQAFAKLSEHLLSNLENATEALAKLAKMLPWILIASCTGAGLSLVAAILGYLIKKGM